MRQARTGRGLTQQAVAEFLGLPRTAVTNLENGGRAVSTLELTRLAELYDRPPAFFLGSNSAPMSEDPAAALRRAAPEIADAPEAEASVRRIVDLCREGAVLRRLLSLPVGGAPPRYSAEAMSPSAAMRRGEEVAAEERRRLGLGDAPVADMAGLAGDQGVWAATADLPDALSGLFVNHPSIGLAIVANGNHAPVRRRFSYAHEYAHALFDGAETAMATRRGNASAATEKRANAFAAAFLIPPGGAEEYLARIGKGQPSRRMQTVFNEVGDDPAETDIRPRSGSRAVACEDAAMLARRFGVGYEAAVWRLRNLRYIDRAAAQSLIERKDFASAYIDFFASDGIENADNRPRATEGSLRSRIARLSIEAFRREEISRGRLAEIAGKLETDAARMLELAEAARV